MKDMTFAEIVKGIERAMESLRGERVDVKNTTLAFLCDTCNENMKIALQDRGDRGDVLFRPIRKISPRM